jgi:hypothetical protein
MDREVDRKNEKEYIEAVRAFCKEQRSTPDTGKEIKFPIADGYARYMILDYRSIILLEVGDVYQIPDAHARGLRKADLVQKVKQEEAISALFSAQNK